MTGKIIDIHDAKIKTAAITIKALSIADRQVTQSVFRQIYEEPLIGFDGRLQGLPWRFAKAHASPLPRQWPPANRR